jgi:hypothetical protein
MESIREFLKKNKGELHIIAQAYKVKNPEWLMDREDLDLFADLITTIQPNKNAKFWDKDILQLEYDKTKVQE